MKESYGEGLASHTGSESCGHGRKAGYEALTRIRAISLESVASTTAETGDFWSCCRDAVDILEFTPEVPAWPRTTAFWSAIALIFASVSGAIRVKGKCE